MNANEETVYLNESRTTIPQQEKQTSGENAAWKSVTIGAVSGILVGAGVIYATKAHAGDMNGAADVNAADEASDALKVAEVSSNQSFGDAFASAREQVGPGGVFHWRGGIYSTYTKEEWDGMSSDEKNLFAESVKPEIRASEIDTTHHYTASAHHNAHTGGHEVHEARSTEAEHVHEARTEETLHRADVVRNETTSEAHSGHAHANGDPDVQILEGPVQLADGRIATHAVIDGVEVVQVDVDGDGTIDYVVADANGDGQADMMVLDATGNGEPDVVAYDANGDGRFSEGEVFDYHTGEELTMNESSDESGMSYADYNEYDNSTDVASVDDGFYSI